jgi:protein ImuB
MGLSRIADLIPLPRAPLARRFGPGLVLRLDQALGVQSEPVAAEPDAPHFGVRMTLPEPIGLQSDVMAGLARLLERLCVKLALHRRGARRMRLGVEIGLARPMRDPSRIAALFAKGVDEIDSGFGIDALRLSAPVTEAMAPEQIGGGPVLRHDDALADLLSSLGNRIGFDRVLRLLPAESLIPDRSYLVIFPPEPVTSASGTPPASFRWRRMRFTTPQASGPERITPEWWLMIRPGVRACAITGGSRPAKTRAFGCS